jgi:tetratricopeptide (TPR) repeat protein
MRELLDQLRRTVTPRRVSGMLAVAGAVAVVGTGWAVVAAPRDPCGAGIDRARPVWNDATRESVVQALVTASPVLGEATSTRVQPRLDAYAQRWVAAHRDACEATQVRYEQSAEQMDRRMQCLDDQFRRLRALVGTLAQADDAVVRGAVRAVDGLAPPERCADAAYVAKQASPPPDSAVVPEVERLRNVLARADALGATGRYADAREAIAEIAADVAAVSYGPLQLEYAHAEAEFIALTGEYAEAESKLRDVLVGARREGAERFEAPAELTLVNVLHKLDRADEALELARLVAARAEHDGDTGLHARALERHGVILSIQGHHDDAIADLERSLELTESYAPDSVSLAAARQALVGAYYRAGKVVKAGDEQRLALEMSERLMGERHPTTIEARAGLSTFQYDTGELGLAIANIETTLEHARDVLGPRHPTTSNYLDMKASFIAASGKYEESLAILEDVLEIRSEAFGARSRQVARTLNNIAATQHDLDREDDAAQTLRQSLEIKREVLGAEHADTINAKINLGAFLAELGKTDEAAPLLEEALASQIALEGEHHPDVLAARANLARLRLDQERVADARLLTDTMIASANETLPPHHVMWAFVWRTDGMVATEEGRFDAAVAAHERELQAAIDAKQTADIERARAILDQSRARAAAR